MTSRPANAKPIDWLAVTGERAGAMTRRAESRAIDAPTCAPRRPGRPTSSPRRRRTPGAPRRRRRAGSPRGSVAAVIATLVLHSERAWMTRARRGRDRRHRSFGPGRQTSNTLARLRQAPIHLVQHNWPCAPVLVSRLLVRETRMGESSSLVVLRCETASHRHRGVGLFNAPQASCRFGDDTRGFLGTEELRSRHAPYALAT
jgi:hypothetical protein